MGRLRGAAEAHHPYSIPGLEALVEQLTEGLRGHHWNCIEDRLIVLDHARPIGVSISGAEPLDDLPRRSVQSAEPDHGVPDHRSAANGFPTQHGRPDAVAEQHAVDHVRRRHPPGVDVDVEMLGAGVPADDEGGAQPAGRQRMVGHLQGLHGSGAAGLELVGRHVVDAEPVGDHVDGRGHQLIRRRGAHHDEVHVGRRDARGGQRATAGFLAQVGQRVFDLSGVQVEGEMTCPGTDESIDPLLPRQTHVETAGQRGVVHGGSGQHRTDRENTDV